MTSPEPGRFEVSGNSDIGLPVEYPMAVAHQLGQQVGQAFAPANGAIGKIQATFGGWINWRGSDAARHIRWSQLIQEPIDADLVDGDLRLLAPGEWTIYTPVYFGWTNLGGDDWVDLTVHVKGSDGVIIRSGNTRLPLGSDGGTLQVRIEDVLVAEHLLPATVEVWFGTGKYRDVKGGAGWSYVSAKKTTRYATATTFTEDPAAQTTSE